MAFLEKLRLEFVYGKTAVQKERCGWFSWVCMYGYEWQYRFKKVKTCIKYVLVRYSFEEMQRNNVFKTKITVNSNDQVY